MGAGKERRTALGSGPYGGEKGRVEAAEKIFKKIFWRSGKDSYLCSPASGKSEREKDRRRKADGEEIKKRGCRAGMRRDTTTGRKRERKAGKFFKEMIHVA